jgi:hypothetical protein
MSLPVTHRRFNDVRFTVGSWGYSGNVANGTNSTLLTHLRHRPPKLVAMHNRQGMRERGYTKDQDFILAYRYAEGRADRMPGLVAELLELGPDVFIAPTTFQAVAASRARFLLSFLFSRTRSVAGLWQRGSPRGQCDGDRSVREGPTSKAA